MAARRSTTGGRVGRPLAALLILTASGLAIASYVLDPRVTVASAGDNPTRLATPMFSARRVPDLLVAPVASRRLGDRLRTALEGAPTHCLTVYDGERLVFGDQADTPVVPASNQKLLTARAAVRVLGAETRLSTQVRGAAPVEGTVSGDLYFVGGGDPLLSIAGYEATQHYRPQPRSAVEELAQAIKDAGITRVTGSVVGDESRYDDARVIPSWPDRYVSQGQVGPLTGLSVDDARQVPGDGAPVGPGSGGGGDGAVDDPATFAAAVLSDQLAKVGVTVDGAPRSGTAPAGSTVLVDFPSLTVADTVGEMLRFSDNNTAELLLKEIGRTAGSEGSTAAGSTALASTLSGDGLPVETATLVDGSGLDRQNRVTCELLSRTLAADGPDGPIARGLAQPGKPGTLVDRFTGSPVADRLRAKTGTLAGVTSLSGWVTTNATVPLVFSFVQNPGERDVQPADLERQQHVVEAMATYPEAIPTDQLGPRAPGA